MTIGPGQILLALAAAAQAAGPAPQTVIWYAIAADAGDVLGYASREIVPGPAGREIIDSSEIRLQELGDPERRVVERTVTRLDPDGRAVSIGRHTQMGPAWSRIEARIGTDAPRSSARRRPNGGRRGVPLAGRHSLRRRRRPARRLGPGGDAAARIRQFQSRRDGRGASHHRAAGRRRARRGGQDRGAPQAL